MSKPTQKRRQPARMAGERRLGLWPVAVAVVAIGAIVLGKQLLRPKPVNPGDPPALQLQQALEQRRVVFALYHSTTCIPCKEMEKVAAAVMPEFKDPVVFVDVNVYDERNLDLLREMQIRVIPTTFIHDRRGQHKVFQGVLSRDALRAELLAALDT